jgi:glycosyltransferase involved in cell wall biosynthesis
VRVLNLVTTPRSRFYRQQVAALADAGVEETTLAVPGHHDYSGGTGETRTPLDYAKFVPKVLRHASREYDLVHANYGLTAPPAVLQQTLPVVVSLWGSDLAGRYGWLSRLSGRFADEVVVMSDRMAESYGRDCRVVPHGVDLDVFRPLPQDEAREDVGWRPDAHHVLFPYPRDRHVKNYPRAERVADRARDRVDGDLVLQTLTGVPHDRMPVYMNAADALLVTSRSEGSPNAVKEALACNLAVVSTDVGDVRERVAGVSLSAVADDDADLAAALAAALRADGRSDGRDAAREISLDAATERLLDVYRAVAD